MQTHSGRVLRKVRAAKTKILDQPSTEEWPVLANVSQMPFLNGNEVDLLIDGEATFDSIFDGISRGARSYCWSSSTSSMTTSWARSSPTRLIERAKAGVKIYLLYDDVGSFGCRAPTSKRLREAGIRCTASTTATASCRLLGPTRIKYRNHRKIVVADGKDAWIGGLNVGDEYMGRSSGSARGATRMCGSRARPCSAADLSFREDWQWATGERADRAADRRPR